MKAILALKAALALAGATVLATVASPAQARIRDSAIDGPALVTVTGRQPASTCCAVASAEGEQGSAHGLANTWS